MTVKRYVKKPVEIEAVQFNGENAFEIWHFMGVAGAAGNPELHNTDSPIINTLEGDMLVSIGDFVIKGLNGEFYPCKPDIFALTYSEVAP